MIFEADFLDAQTAIDLDMRLSKHTRLPKYLDVRASIKISRHAFVYQKDPNIRLSKYLKLICQISRHALMTRSQHACVHPNISTVVHQKHLDVCVYQNMSPDVHQKNISASVYPKHLDTPHTSIITSRRHTSKPTVFVV